MYYGLILVINYITDGVVISYTILGDIYNVMIIVGTDARPIIMPHYLCITIYMVV